MSGEVRQVVRETLDAYTISGKPLAPGWVLDVLAGQIAARLAAVPVPSETGLAVKLRAVLDAYAPTARYQRGRPDQCGCTDCEMAEDLRALLSERTATTGGGGS